MNFTILNGILLSPNWTSFLYKAVLTIGIGSACVISMGKNRCVFNHFSLFFSKIRITDSFKFSIPDFDICLN